MKSLIALAIVSATAGCGTLFNEDSTDITITAPEGVKILVDGSPTPTGVTPLSNKKPHVVTAFDKDNNLVGTCNIDTTVRGKYLIGDLFLGFWPVVIDVLTGGWYDLDKSSCSF